MKQPRTEKMQRSQIIIMETYIIPKIMLKTVTAEVTSTRTHKQNNYLKFKTPLTLNTCRATNNCCLETLTSQEVGIKLR